MTLLELAVLLVIAAIVGSLGQLIAGFYLGGCLVSMIVGFVGAFIGVWLARELGLPEIFVVTVGDESFPIVWGIIGSAIFALIAGLLLPRPVEMV